MHKSLLRILPVFILLLVLVSCQKSDDLDATNLENDVLSAADYIDRYVKQDVLFQYAKINEEGHTTEGWLINRDGQVRAYTFRQGTWETEVGTCSTADMARLEGAESTVLTAVDLDQLVGQYQLIAPAAESTPQVFDDGKVGNSTAFYAYRYHENIATSAYNGSCGDHEQSFSDPYYDQVLLLKQGGAITSRNTSTAATQITEWLQSVQEEVQF